jgi:hypothetical protein
MHPVKPMFTSTTPPRRWALWLALLLALLGALAPSVSQALTWARGGNAGLIEVCTSSGPRWMALGTFAAEADFSDATSLQQPVPDAPVSAQVLDHCPFCLLLADRAAPPPAHWSAMVLAAGQAAAPADRPLLFYPPFSAPAPPSRAPPTPL